MHGSLSNGSGGKASFLLDHAKIISIMAQIKDQVENKVGQMKNKADRYNPEHREGQLARSIEDYTSRLPSDTYLWAAVGCMAISATLKLMGRSHDALFVGQWPAPFLLMGLYNKIVKVEGHDSQSKRSNM
jgi:hypothetical protein